MAEDESKAGIAWIQFDRVVADAAPDGTYRNPWVRDAYAPDFDTLRKLLGIARGVAGKATQSGVLANALDVWLAYELRCAGFDQDAVWPRATPPRIVPTPLTKLYRSFEASTREAAAEAQAIQARLMSSKRPAGVVSARASVLGKNYMKQVDVLLTGWDTGPEILISTKRMDAALGKNSANRVEESYGDAKNLRGRHPLAALGFVYGLGAPALRNEPGQAAQLIDLLQKLGNEDDAYNAVCLLLLDYDPNLPALDVPAELREAASVTAPDPMVGAVERQIARAPEVWVMTEVVVPASSEYVSPRELRLLVPPDLQAGAALKTLVEHVLKVTPIALHTEARIRRGWPFQVDVGKRRRKRSDADVLMGLDIELPDDDG